VTNQQELELPYWLVIHRMRGIGPRRFAALLQQESSLSNCFNDRTPTRDFKQWCQQVGVPDALPDWEGVAKDLAWAQSADCKILTWDSLDYPRQLKESAGCPPVLFVKGKAQTLHLPQLALVGSRQPTAQGQSNAHHFAFELAKQGFTITSGLALGIDCASHEGALAADGLTIAVLGNGLDRVYPAKHHALAHRICEQGALVSEFPLGTQPRAEHFPQRNRIISGLSLGIVVIESALKSGSLITANYALEQGREVYALPGSIHNPLAKGCHQLIRQGAKCVDSVEHILEELPLGIKREQAPPRQILQQDLSLQEPLLAHIGMTVTPIDLMIDKSGLTAETVSSMLLELELQGVVASVPGGYIQVARGGKA